MYMTCLIKYYQNILGNSHNYQFMIYVCLFNHILILLNNILLLLELQIKMQIKILS
jgi:hypothetical protein